MTLVTALHLLNECAYVSGKLKLVLDVLRWLDINAGPHDDPPYKLLADEVPDLDLELVR
jgi:hypothetical protein